MNILPKKRWHVRTKDNIARVRRDEAEAKEKERQREEKLKFAESEARINYLRRQNGIATIEKNSTKESVNEISTLHGSGDNGHIDLFADYKSHINLTNKDLEKEKKEEKEKYEKQIGYLTYLGQDTNEALKLRSWYEVAPERRRNNETVSEKDTKNKIVHDPLTLINAMLPPEKDTRKKSNHIPAIQSDISIEDVVVEHKTSKHKNKSRKKVKDRKKRKHEKKEKRKRNDIEDELRQLKREKIGRLRKERLRREAKEQVRQENLLNPKSNETAETHKNITTSHIVQKYNSQFNPEIAKQNMT